MNALAQFPPSVEFVAEPAVLRAVLDACPQAMAVTEKERVLVANLALARCLGLDPRAELSGLPLSSVFPEWSTNQTDVLARNGTRLSISRIELTVANRDLCLLSTSESPRIEAVPSPGHMEALGRLVGGVAHDFNNLLTGIMLY